MGILAASRNSEFGWEDHRTTGVNVLGRQYSAEAGTERFPGIMKG